MNEDAAEHLKKTFTAENNEMVVEKDITFYSMCEHHMLPFYGKVHIAYIPDGKVVGLSKLARTVEVFARRLQLQEQMTAQIADALMENLHPKGVMVLAEAEHMCMTCLLYTSDAADEEDSVDLDGRRIIKKKRMKNL